jgi:hypothetical protein
MDRVGQHQSLLQQHRRTHSRSSSEGNRTLKLDASDTDPLTKSEGGKATVQSITPQLCWILSVLWCIRTLQEIMPVWSCNLIFSYNCDWAQNPLLTATGGADKFEFKGFWGSFQLLLIIVIITPWSESASELDRPSDLRLSAKWLPTFADRGCHVVSVTDP